MLSYETVDGSFVHRLVITGAKQDSVRSFMCEVYPASRADDCKQAGEAQKVEYLVLPDCFGFEAGRAFAVNRCHARCSNSFADDK